VYPVQTHIRNDFALLAMNQLVNMAAKYKYMYGGVFEVPMLVRMVIGRSWGQGAQHSQSLQSLFAHIPGLAVIMPASADSVLTAYNYAVNSYRGPVISLEHRLLYEYMFNSSYNGKAGRKHLFGSKCVRAGTDLTIVATSVMVIEAQRAAAYLEEECRIRCEIIDLHSITHFDRELVLNSVSKTRHLLVADTSWQAYGVAAELARLICETDPSLLKRPMASLGMQPSPCPTAKKLENLFYPDGFRFVEKALDVLGKGGGEALRKEQFTDVYPLFRGPF
jgi:pyruvate dehydrogenase E1 component beta subunit